MFAKVFNQIFDSSIREHPDTRFTFMDFLVLADRHGIVDMTHEAIAARTNRPLDLIRRTITELEAPDPKSRTPDFNGARIKRLDDHRDWGWLIINYEKFRWIASEEQRREKTKDRTRKWRGRNVVTHSDAPVTHGDACDAMQRQKYTTSVSSTDSNVDRYRATVLHSAPTQLCWSSAGGWVGLTDSLKVEFSQAYPACDIPLQFRRMDLWLKANPLKAHKKNWRRFATNWLSRKQERGGDVKTSKTTSKAV